MEWWLVIALLLGGMLTLIAIGLPVAFAFLVVNIVGAFFIMGGWAGVGQVVPGIFTSLTSFILIPVPLFIFMGEVMFHSGIGMDAINAIDKWLGRLPGRMSLLAIASGTLFSALSGSTIANTALLGTTLMPEMSRRGYKKPMSLGPIVGTGGLAMLIPPSALAVIWASLAYVSVGEILLAGVMPALMMAIFYGGYVILRCWLQPSLAPRQEITHIPLSDKIVSSVKYILPLAVVIFLVVGVIFLGIATPTEASATGALSALILAAAYKRVDLAMLKRCVGGTLRVTVMVFMIILASRTFSQLLAFSGATQDLVQFITSLGLSRIGVIIVIQITLLFLGMFMEQVSIMMIAIPIFMPIVYALAFDPVWFGMIFLLNLEMGLTTPPFGMLLFVMKGIAPPDVTMGDIWRAAAPFLIIDLLVMVLMIRFPIIPLWLPGLMG